MQLKFERNSRLKRNIPGQRSNAKLTSVQHNHAPVITVPHSTENLKKVTALVTSTFSTYDKHAQKHLQIKPIVQGSMGLLLHGVDFQKNDNPGDVDILASNVKLAHQIICCLGEHLEKTGSPYRIVTRGNILVYDCTFVDTTKENPDLTVQLVNKDDFGAGHIVSVEKEGIPVLPPKEAFISLHQRINREGGRRKDWCAFYTLIEKYGEEFLQDGSLQEEWRKEIKEYLALPQDEKEHRKFNGVAPTTDVEDTFAVPKISTEQLAKPELPPAKGLIVQVSMFNNNKENEKQTTTTNPDNITELSVVI
ncbi:Uncharacterised protein [Legionella steigerwaltii]|uniref:Uncharacterized protein n=1 Tax=Legionella steigerwaltii TaxID=460 RepID=A0A378LBC2_9GAMM|nr:hypothetical protein [Legionella steigerwaltii]KTD70290.1 hypothetical protein Lstg_3292 [Legionella steigerwaltii]STY24024.1 Uncharacterised protein [Legionella steigerwaltii]